MASGVNTYQKPTDPYGGMSDRFEAELPEDRRGYYNRNKLDTFAKDISKRQNATMQGAQIGQAAQIATGPQAETRTRQGQALDMFAAAARGHGPSAAQTQLKMGADRAMASNLAMAAAGGTPAAARQAAFMNAAAQQDLAGQSAMLRAQEQQQAMGMLGQYAQAARQQDIDLASQQAGLNQQALLTQAGLMQDTNKANLLAGIEQQRQKDDLLRQYTAAGLQLDDNAYMRDLQNRQFNAQLLTQQQAAERGVALQQQQVGGQVAGASLATVGAVLGGLAAGGAFASDERVKENVSDGDKSVQLFLDALVAKDYDYKDPQKHGEGRRTGIMAQDLEKSEAGRRMVVQHPDGTKMVDLTKASSMSLAALASINKRLKKLEG